MINVITRYRSFSCSEKKLAIQILYYLTIAKYYSSFLGIQGLIKRLNHNKTHNLTDPEEKNIQKVVVLTKSISNKLPWKSRCLQEAIAMKLYLNKQKIKNIIKIGVKKDDSDNLTAHAWLTIDDTIIIGHHKTGEYTEITTI